MALLCKRYSACRVRSQPGFCKEKSARAKCWSFPNELANVSVLGPMVASICISDAVRVEYLMSFIAVLNNFELLMMNEEFYKKLV